MLLKTLLLFFLLVAANFLFGQNIDVLKLKKKPNYSEKNIVYTELPLRVIHEVFYNERTTIDEEYSLILTLSIIDSEQLKKLTSVDVKKDSSIMKCNFDFSSVWNWREEDTEITGTVIFISATKTKINLQLDVTVKDIKKNKVYIYKGTRSFKKNHESN